jgi:hypothetical protein
MPTRYGKNGKLEYYTDNGFIVGDYKAKWFFEEIEFEGSCSSSSCSRTHGYCKTCNIDHDDFIKKEEFEI